MINTKHVEDSNAGIIADKVEFNGNLYINSPSNKDVLSIESLENDIDPIDKELLCYYLDRRFQFQKIRNMIENLTENDTTQNMIWLIPGSENQCHDLFISCLARYETFIINNKMERIACNTKYISFPIYQDNEGFDDTFIKNLAESIGVNDFSPEKICDEIDKKNKGRPYIIYSNFCGKDWKNGIKYIEEFIQIVKKFKRKHSYLIFCLLVVYEKNWLCNSFFYRYRFNKIAKKYPKYVFPELCNIQKSDVKKWLNKEIVKKYFLFCDPQDINIIFSYKKSLPIEDLVKKLKKIVRIYRRV